MELTGLGGGIMLAIAAALWLVYLVPNWLRRREYLATERNAVRLQQTIRVLAETSEPPVLPRRLTQGPVAVGRPPSLPARPDPQLLQARRVRRTRGFATFVLLTAVVVGAVSLANAAWLVVGASALAGVVAVSLLARLAEVSRNRRAPVTARPVSQPLDDSLVGSGFEQTPVASWTPVPMPKPVYLSRSEAPAASSATDLAASLRAAALASEEALRAAAPPAPVGPAAAPAAPAARSRFASMGIVDAAATGTPDLDAALARRRAG